MSAVSEREDVPDSRWDVSIHAVVSTVIESICEVWKGLDLSRLHMHVRMSGRRRGRSLAGPGLSDGSHKRREQIAATREAKEQFTKQGVLQSTQELKHVPVSGMASS